LKCTIVASFHLITFWGIDLHGKDCLYKWNFFPFGLKNTHIAFQKVMDRMLTSIGFTKCNINGIIVFNLTQEITCIICNKCLEKEHNLKLHASKCWFIHTHVKYLGDIIYLGKLRV
jgi:hypothetical protein